MCLPSLRATHPNFNIKYVSNTEFQLENKICRRSFCSQSVIEFLREKKQFNVLSNFSFENIQPSVIKRKKPLNRIITVLYCIEHFNVLLAIVVRAVSIFSLEDILTVKMLVDNIEKPYQRYNNFFFLFRCLFLTLTII